MIWDSRVQSELSGTQCTEMQPFQIHYGNLLGLLTISIPIPLAGTTALPSDTGGKGYMPGSYLLQVRIKYFKLKLPREVCAQTPACKGKVTNS